MPETQVLKFNYESAKCVLTIWDETKATLIDVCSTDRKKGHATELLKMLTAFADKRGLKLITAAEAYGNEPGLSTDQLVMFYTKFGFVALGDDPEYMYMERQPK